MIRRTSFLRRSALKRRVSNPEPTIRRQLRGEAKTSFLHPFRRKNRIPDQKYQDYIRSFACVVCVLLNLRQRSKTQCCHVGLRGLGTKCSDRETLPFCRLHHREQHASQKRFWKVYGLDRVELVRTFQESFCFGLRDAEIARGDSAGDIQGAR